MSKNIIKMTDKQVELKIDIGEENEDNSQSSELLFGENLIWTFFFYKQQFLMFSGLQVSTLVLIRVLNRNKQRNSGNLADSNE